MTENACCQCWSKIKQGFKGCLCEAHYPGGMGWLVQPTPLFHQNTTGWKKSFVYMDQASKGKQGGPEAE